MPWTRGFELNEKRCVGYVCYFKMFVGWEADVYGIWTAVHADYGMFVGLKGRVYISMEVFKLRT